MIIPGDMTHPLNTPTPSPYPICLAGTPDAEHRVEARDLFPELPEGYTDTQMLDFVHGASVIRAETADLPSAEVVQEIANALRSKMIVVRLAGELHGRSGMLYHADGKGPFPEDDSDDEE